MPILPLTARIVAILRAPSDEPRIGSFDAEVPGLSCASPQDGVEDLDTAVSTPTDAGAD